MRCLVFIHLYFTISVVQSTCKVYENDINDDSETETNCNNKITDDSCSDCDDDDKNEVNSIHKVSQNTSVRVTSEGKEILDDVTPKPTVTTVFGINSIESENNETSHEADSLDEEPKTTVATATEYIENFTTNVSETTVVKNWRYRGNKSSEESDEAKSTLIDYPFSVSIQRKGSHYTTGALLDKWWIITVAGEFYNVRDTLKLFRARLGTVDCKRGGTVVPLKKIEFHPYYIHGKPNFDVALLRMAYFIDFSDFIRPIALSTLKGKVVSAKFMTTYWPRILNKGSILPKTANERIKYNSMRVSTQRLIPQQKCMKLLKDLNEMLNESTLCLKPVISHHSVCMPDPGAPVVAEDGLWGITSSWISPKCPQKPAPTVFTRLSSPSVRSWLLTVLHNHG